MALVGVELETLVSEQDALTTRPPLCALFKRFYYYGKVRVTIFQSFEYVLSKIFFTCGT